uniref:CCHC-type domain-containing protein n=1 Tax=Trichuris muris TaxID=70415 RepID=A0A5S6Q1F8_TRIMR
MDTGKSFDLKLIPEFDGSARQSVAEWLEKVELVCKLRGIDDIATIIALRLTGGAFAVYPQLADKDRKSPAEVKGALLSAFAVDPYVAYELFVRRKLGVDESPDVFLAELRRLTSLFGGVSERTLACAFVAGLPEGVRQLLRAGSRMENLCLSEILTRARVVIVDEHPPVRARVLCFGTTEVRTVSRTDASKRRCFSCGGLNHFARNCPIRRKNLDSGKKENEDQRPQTRNSRRKACRVPVPQRPGNDLGEEA